MCHSGILQICCAFLHTKCLLCILRCSITTQGEYAKVKSMTTQLLSVFISLYPDQLSIEGDLAQFNGTSFKKCLWQTPFSARLGCSLCDWFIGHVPACLPWCGPVTPMPSASEVDFRLFTCHSYVRLRMFKYVKVGKNSVRTESNEQNNWKSDTTQEHKDCLLPENSSSSLWKWTNLFQNINFGF